MSDKLWERCGANQSQATTCSSTRSYWYEAVDLRIAQV